MATVASLAVSITARTSGLTKGLRGARKAVNGFARNLQRSGATAVGFAGSLLAAAGVAGVGALVRGQMEAIDSTAKLADRLNIGTESLVAYQYIAELAGSSSEQVSKGIEKLTKSIGDAATGASKDLEPAFRALGTTSQELARMAPDRAFERVAQGIAKIQNPAVRAAVVTKLFGRSGQALTNTLIEIAEKSEDARRRTEKFGLAFSRVDAAAVERANDAMRDVGFVIEGVATQIGVQLAPYIETVAVRLAEMGTAGAGAGQAIRSGFEAALMVAAKVADVVNLLEGAWYGFKAAVEGIAAGILKTLETILKGWGMLIEKLSFGRLKYVESDNPLTAMANGFAEAMQESATKSAKALSDFANGTESKKARAFLDDVAARAEVLKGAAVRPQTTDHSLGRIPDLGTTARKASEFLQIDLARTALGGGGRREPTVSVRQLDETNDLLRRILARGGTTAAVAV